MTVLQGLGTDMTIEVAGEKFEKAILETVLAISMTLTAKYGSTVTLTTKDPQHLLVKAGYFNTRAEAFIDRQPDAPGLPFTAVAFKKKVDEFTLEFEDRDFWLLKEGPQSKKKYKQLRGAMTVQQFTKKVINEICPHCNFVCPELNTPDRREPTKVSGEGESESAAPGALSASSSAQVGGTFGKQREFCEAFAGYSGLKLSVVIAWALQEQPPESPAYPGSNDWLNIEEPGGKGGPEEHRIGGMPPAAAAKATAEWMQKYQPTITASKTGSEKAQAEAIVNSGWAESKYGGIAKFYGVVEGIGKLEQPASKAGTTLVETAQYFELNQKSETAEEGEEDTENLLSGLEELLEPGKWLLWKSGNAFFLYSQAGLAKERPTLSGVKEQTEPGGTPGVLDIGYELDHSKKRSSKVIIECRAHLWEALPGQLVSFDDSVGEEISRDPKTGGFRKWIVLNIERKDITDNTTTVELILPEQVRLEKGIELKEKKVAGVVAVPGGNNERQTHAPGAAGAGTLTGESVLYKALGQMIYIANEHRKYKWGGGHDPSFTPSVGDALTAPIGGESITEIGWDCSGAASSVLHAAGLMVEALKIPEVTRKFVGPQGSAWFETWGDPGPGQHMTVISSADHVLIGINVPASLCPSQNTANLPKDSKGWTWFAATTQGQLTGFYDSFEAAGGVPGMTERHWEGL